MSNARAGTVWLIIGALALGGLWLAIGFAPAYVGIAGFGLLLAPLVCALVTFAPVLAHDRISALCIAGLALLYLLAWFL